MTPDDIRQIHQLLQDQGTPLDVTVTPVQDHEPPTPGSFHRHPVKIAVHGDEIILEEHPELMLMQVKQILQHYPQPVTVNEELLETSPAPTEAASESMSTGHPLIHSPMHEGSRRLPGSLNIQGLSYHHGIRQVQYRPATTQFADHFTVAEKITVEPHISVDALPEVVSQRFAHYQLEIPPEGLRQADEQYAAAESRLDIYPSRPEPMAAWPPPPSYYGGDDVPRNLLWTDLTPVNLAIDDPALAFTVAAALYGQNHGYVPVSEPVPGQLTLRSMDIMTTNGDTLTIRSADDSPSQRPVGARASSITLHLEVDGHPIEASAHIALCGSREKNNEAFFVTEHVTDPEFLTSMMMKAFWQPPYHGSERFDNSHYVRALSTAAVRAINGEDAGLPHEADRLLTNFKPQSALPVSGEFSFEHDSGWTLTYRAPESPAGQ